MENVVPPRPRIDVVCGVILRDDGRVLAARRGPGMSLAGEWEFPGGKPEGGEDDAAALRRELREELGVEVEVGPPLGESVHDTGKVVIHLRALLARITAGEPVAHEHDALRWTDAAERATLGWATADVPLVALLDRAAIAWPGGALALNRAGYDAIAARWADARAGFFGPEREFVDRLVERLPAGAEVLDLGCGSGRPIAEHLASRGFAVTGVDQSAGLLAIARERVPGGTFVEAGIEGWVHPRRVGAIVCWDSLFHVPRLLWPGILARLRDTLSPGGRLMLTSGGSEHPAFEDSMWEARFHYDALPPEALRGLLRELGFRVVLDVVLNPPTAGRDKGRIGLLVERP